MEKLLFERKIKENWILKRKARSGANKVKEMLITASGETSNKIG
uniref:Uncharacterized protein n=1 Tax=Meloidogyne enterolobii TaxID=390850 RepID=A0A6V7TKF5_MELEN|nr:unnamed protein product [Meloidogyne enterolobii]